MNYYPFHLGDYAVHTAHLEPLEDLAYRRMLDAYYLREAPLPADLAEVARLIRMRQNMGEVEVVLREFFTPTDDGWRHIRCDSEIERMREKQEQSETRDSHERDRMKRHRERRAEMFDALRKVGVIPTWDVSIKELQRLHDEHCNAHETNLQRACNATATAIPTPTPTPNKETFTDVNVNGAKRARTTAKQPEGVTDQTWDDFQKQRKAHKAPLTDTAMAQIISEANKARYTIEQALQTCCARGWRSFKADWVAAAASPTARASHADRSAPLQSFAERDREAGMQRWEQMTGRVHPDRQQAATIIIDAQEVLASEPLPQIASKGASA